MIRVMPCPLVLEGHVTQFKMAFHKPSRLSFRPRVYQQGTSKVQYNVQIHAHKQQGLLYTLLPYMSFFLMLNRKKLECAMQKSQFTTNNYKRCTKHLGWRSSRVIMFTTIRLRGPGFKPRPGQKF